MRHYEIIFMIYPDKDIYVNDIINNYINIIKKKGIIHRLENWGLKKLSYNIKNFDKAYYILMNIEVNISLIKFINDDLNLNKNILRFLIIKKKKAIIKSSCMLVKDNK